MAVTTARDLIEKSLKEILVLGIQDTITAEELNDGLDALNLMLDTWWTERLACFTLRRETFNLVSGQQTYTIGPGGNFNTTWPVRIAYATVSYLNVNYPLEIIDAGIWDAITYKQNSGIPMSMFYDRQYPLGNINVYPIPPSTGFTILLDSYERLQSFATLTDNINLPPGYARALIKNLAVEQAPQYNKKVSPELRAQALESKGWVKRINRTDVVSSFDPTILRNVAGYNVWGDTSLL